MRLTDEKLADLKSESDRLYAERTRRMLAPAEERRYWEITVQIQDEAIARMEEARDLCRSKLKQCVSRSN